MKKNARKNANGPLVSRRMSRRSNKQHLPRASHRIASHRFSTTARAGEFRAARAPRRFTARVEVVNYQSTVSYVYVQRYFHYKAIRLYNAGSAGGRIMPEMAGPPFAPVWSTVCQPRSHVQEFQVGLLNNEEPELARASSPAS